MPNEVQYGSCKSAKPKSGKNRSYLLAALLAVVAVGWVASGALNDDAPVVEKTVADRNAQETAAIRVRIKELSAVDHPRVLIVTGRTNAIKDA